MNETVSRYPSHAEDLIDQIDSFSETAREAFPKLDGQLMPLVAANADVIIRCPWMAGAEVPLGTAMINYPNLMTEEAADQIISGVHDLLANRVKPKEELEEEEGLEEQTEEEPVKDTKMDESKTRKPSQKKTDQTEKQRQRNIATEKVYKQPAIVGDIRQSRILDIKPDQTKRVAVKTKSATSMTSEAKAPKFEVVAEPIPSTSKPDRVAVKAESAKSSNIIAASPVDIISADAAAMPDYNVIETKPVPNETKKVADQIIKSIEPAALNFEQIIIPAHSLGRIENIEMASEVINYQMDVDVPATIPDEISPVVDQAVETINLTSSDILVTTPTVDSVEPVDGVSLESNIELASEVANHQIGIDEPVERVFVVAHGEEDQVVQVEPIDKFGPKPALWPSAEPKIAERTEDTAEQSHEVKLTIEEVEESLVRLVEIIETSQPDATEEVNGILDQIIEAPKNLKDVVGEKIEVEDILQGELEELFTELFTVLNIESTPETIEALVELTIKYHSIDRIEKLMVEEEPDQTASDVGTHEIVNLLHQSLNTNKKTFTEANLIGNFAIRLYTFNTFDFAAEYVKRYGLPQAA